MLNGLKMKPSLRKLIGILLCSFFVMPSAWAAQDFLSPEKAFPVELTWLENSNTVAIEYLPVKGYYIYQESLKFKVLDSGKEYFPKIRSLPPGIEKFDETFNKKLQVYKKPFTVLIDLPESKGLAPSRSGIHLELELQGCAEGGICYPPMSLQFRIAAPGVRVTAIPDASLQAQLANQTQAKADFWQLWHDRDDINSINTFLNQTSSTYLFLAFFILGLALAFTPCILPMLPILSSIVLGASHTSHISQTRSRREKARAGILALAYILGMALLYSLAGVLTALIGGGVQQVLQSPAALVLFALLLLALAMSLFGLFHLRLPHAWQVQVDRLSGRHQGGSIVGAFALGAISTLVASPCITAPLAGILGFIAQSGSVFLGGGLLFVMALGMGLPLLLIAVGARQIIPKSGPWMIWIQRSLGFVLLALAVWVISPLFLPNKVNEFSQKQIQGNLIFTVIKSNAELDAVLVRAKNLKKPVLLDFYADWCISCKEMEKLTFADPAVARLMQDFILVQADVTANQAESTALLKRFKLFGPPAILFFNLDGQEQTALRVVGFMKADHFSERLQTILVRP